MASIVVSGDTSGAITIAAPAVAGTNTLTLPASTGTLVVTGGAQTIEFADGSASAPSITNSGDTNTGMFFPAADTISFTEGGTESMRITSTGTVAIGTTTTPTAKLWIESGRVGLTNAYKLGWHSNPAHGDLGNYITGDDNSNYVALGTGGSERMRIASDGKVGIGTSSPSNPLDVVSDGGAAAMTMRGRSSDNISTFRFTSNDAATTYGQIQSRSNGMWVNAVANIPMQFFTNDSERVRITSGGYTKCSNDGTYVNSTGTYHEFRNTASDPVIFATATNASYGSNALIIDVTRSASSSNTFGVFRSSAGGDTEFVFRGDGQAYADGTWNNNGADYAEFFESATGQAIPVGSTVVLDGNKIRLATASDSVDDVIGVVRPKEPSKASMIVGNTAWNKWANKYLSDDFDRYIMEDHNVVEWTDEDGKEHSYESHNIPVNVVVPADAVVKTHDDKGNKFQHYKLNPAWNPDAEYVNRENRDEWLIIGLVGQVKVLKGQKMGSRWVKMRDVSANVEEWFIR